MSIWHTLWKMNQDTNQVKKALAAVQRALAVPRLSDAHRLWLEVLYLKLIRLRERGLALRPEQSATLKRLTRIVEDILFDRGRPLN